MTDNKQRAKAALDDLNIAIKTLEQNLEDKRSNGGHYYLNCTEMFVSLYHEDIRLALTAMAADNHCKDCCCAKCWDALGITEYTGKSIPEHIKELKAMLSAAPQVKAETVEIPEGFRMSPEQNIVWDWAAAHGLTLVADECNDLLWRLENHNITRKTK